MAILSEGVGGWDGVVGGRRAVIARYFCNIHSILFITVDDFCFIFYLRCFLFCFREIGYLLPAVVLVVDW